MKYALLSLLVVSCLGCAASDDKLVIHEWGTFTSLQNDAGAALGGLNADAEALPSFVKTLNLGFVASETPFDKGFFLAHPEISMRLETPVVYFHPPKNMALPFELDFSVQFKGGWLTQYYPDAIMSAPGIKGSKRTSIGRLTPATVGTLSWIKLKVGVNSPVPETSEKVWLAPRAVDAALVANAKGEAEKYLFYRGVGNIAAPLKVMRTDSKLCITPQIDPALVTAEGTPLANETQKIHTLWLAHFRSGGTCAFKQIKTDSFANLKGTDCVETTDVFSPGDYAAENVSALRSAMHGELVADGLYADEADALLNTWNAAYFKSSGLRLFFLVPRGWTDHYLPLKVSIPADIVRTMVGRIELISPEQRAALDALSTATNLNDEALATLYSSVQKLGRFTTPLLWDRFRTQPTPGIKFAKERFTTPAYTLEDVK